MSDNFYKRLAKEGRLNISEDISMFINAPLYSMQSFANKNEPDIEKIHLYGYETLKVIVPEKINYELASTRKSDHLIDSLVYSLKGTIEREMQKLEAAGIPVFVNKNTVPHFDYAPGVNRIVANYQIPKELMYKSFFVLHNFDTAVKKGVEYAMQQVQKVIDRY
ncbi:MULTISPECIES: hypothetical protein [Flavobacteriaceae]|uniref:hypothetical protein n=1 Tax=Flavobacteriaceae TaxID=49546 RepID=UPI003A92B0E6